MIVVEERLMELFNLLPEMGSDPDNDIPGVKPVYYFGDGMDLNKWIIAKNHGTYPLIFQNLTNEKQFPDRRYVETTLEIVLCVQTRTDLHNTERWATSYKTILMPLFNMIDDLFQKCGIITSDFEYDVKKFPNYSQTDNRDKNAVVDILDAIRFRLPCKILNGCITPQIKIKQ